MCHVCLVPLTWCGLPPGLVGTLLLEKSQSRWWSAGRDTEARYAQSLMKIDEHCPSCSISNPSSRRQAPVESESVPEICSLVPEADSGGFSEQFDKLQSRGAGTSGCASSRPAGKEDSEASDENEPLPVPKSAPAVSRRRHHRLRILIDHLMCRNGKLEFLLLQRRAVRALAVRRSRRTVLGKFLKCVKKHALHLAAVNDARVTSPSDCFVLGFQHLHGSLLLAVVVDRWPSFSRFWVQQTAEECSSFDSVHPHFTGNVHAPV